MDRKAKEVFELSASASVIFVAGLALGAFLLLMEFGMAFGSSHNERVWYAIVATLLFILNPVGVIGGLGWFGFILGIKPLLPPGAAIIVFIIGGGVWSSFLVGRVDWMVDRYRTKKLTRRVRRYRRRV